jgi:hypothetical protein
VTGGLLWKCEPDKGIALDIPLNNSGIWKPEALMLIWIVSVRQRFVSVHQRS